MVTILIVVVSNRRAVNNEPGSLVIHTMTFGTECNPLPECGQSCYRNYDCTRHTSYLALNFVVTFYPWRPGIYTRLALIQDIAVGICGRLLFLLIPLHMTACIVHEVAFDHLSLPTQFQSSGRLLTTDIVMKLSVTMKYLQKNYVGCDKLLGVKPYYVQYAN